MNDSALPSMQVVLGDLKLKNPVISCSGTFASGLEYADFYDIGMLGAVTTKSFSLEERKGNPPPRVYETACGMLNSIGLQNRGIADFLKNHLPALKKIGVKPILSIFGEDTGEFEKISVSLEGHLEHIKAIELNLSCPNVEKGGMAFCAHPDQVRIVTSMVRDIVKIPIIAKLSPNTGHIESAFAAREGGASAVSLINTLVGTSFDIETFKPRLGNIIGGLSGPAVKPVALAKVYELCSRKIIPVIGMGGIFSGKDAIEFMVAGASAVGIGTINFVDYHAGERIIREISDYLNRKNIKDINDIIGKVFS